MASTSSRGAISIACLAVLAVACSGSPTSNASPLPTGALAHNAEILQGRTTFAANCATCHGTSGGGGIGPRFTGGKLQRDFPNIAAQIAFVDHGRGVMPAWKGALTTEEIHAVVSYEREVLSRR
jgi:mono/diheme cytochrome c family protein